MKEEKFEKFARNVKAVNPTVFVKPLPKLRTNKKRWVMILLGILIMGLIGASGYYYWQFKKIKANPNAASQQDVKKLVTEVSNIIELPQGVDPTVATVSNKDQLQDQDFFKGAENGDKILIYASSKMAILYRPSTKKIIRVAPLVLGQNDTNSSNTNQASQ